jgi:hypothetical protein
MECLKCGTWNPDDKVRCWRCNAELPKPPEPRKSKKLSSQTWMWILVAIFILVTMLFRCNPFDSGGGESTGFLPPSFAPSPSWQRLGSAVVSGRAQGAPASEIALPIFIGYSTMDGAFGVGS